MNIILEEGIQLFGGGCDKVDKILYYMGGYIGQRGFEDVIKLDLQKDYSNLKDMLWKYDYQQANLSKKKPNFIFSSVIARGGYYKDIYIMGGKDEAQNQSFWFYDTENKIWNYDDLSSNLYDNVNASLAKVDDLKAVYLSSLVRNPVNKDNFLLYGGKYPKIINEQQFNLGIKYYEMDLRGWYIEKKDILYNVYDHDSCTYKDAMYVMGGMKESDNSFNEFKDIQIYNLTEKKWKLIQAKGDIPGPRIGHTVVNYEDNIILVGGATNQSLKEFPDLIYAYHIPSNTWQQKYVKDFAAPGYRGCIRIIDNQLIISLGYSNNASKPLQILDVNKMQLKSHFETNYKPNEEIYNSINFIIGMIFLAVFLFLLSLAGYYFFTGGRHKRNEKEKEKALNRMLSQDSLFLTIPKPMWEPPTPARVSPIKEVAELHSGDEVAFDGEKTMVNPYLSIIK